MSIRIPDEAVSSVEFLFGLSEKPRERLLQSLQQADPEPSPERLAGKISKRSELPFNESGGLLSLILNLYVSCDRGDSDFDSFLDSEVAEAFAVLGKETIVTSGPPWEAVRGFLAAAFQTPAVSITAKAWRLALSHEKIFLSTRLLTDVRPIFGKDASAPPESALVVNALQLVYIDGGMRRELFLGLDTEDLVELRRTVDRAITKNRAVAALLKRSGIRQIDFVQTTEV